ncbi:hypothetical protein ACWD4T_02750 [Streptomyces umbrinus]
MTTPAPATLASHLLHALVDDARHHATSQRDRDFVDRVSNTEDTEKLTLLTDGRLVSQDLVNAVGAVLRHLDPATYAARLNAAGELTSFDFLELVAFDAKAESEGLADAWAEHRPEFEAPALREQADDRRALTELLDRFRDEIRAFWRQPDADDRYYAHLEEADRRSSAR